MSLLGEIREDSTLNVIAIGGGRVYAGETENIDDYVFSILPKENKSIAILATASKDRPDYIEVLREQYKKRGAKTLVILEKDLIENKLQEILSNSSGLYIGGGDIAYLLKRLEDSGSIGAIKEYAKGGNIVVGLSAGAALLFEKAIFVENEHSESVDGLGILNGVIIPHFTDYVLQKCKDIILSFEAGKEIYGISNGTALHFSSKNRFKSISEPNSVGGWKISVNSGTVTQEKIHN